MSSKKTGTVKTTKYEKSKNGTGHDASGNSPEERGKIMYGTEERAEKRAENMLRAVLAGLLLFAALIATVIFVNYIRDRQITTVPPTPSKVDFNKNGFSERCQKRRRKPSDIRRAVLGRSVSARQYRCMQRCGMASLPRSGLQSARHG